MGETLIVFVLSAFALIIYKTSLVLSWFFLWALAEKHGLDVCQMALKFVDKQNFVTSTIIGATSMEQLKTDIDAFDINLSDEVMSDIDAVYRQYSIPF